MVGRRAHRCRHRPPTRIGTVLTGSARPVQGAGRLVGGNLCTLNLLQGTPYWPSLDGVILAVEDDFQTDPATFARDLTSLLQQPDAAGISGLMVGRFQRASGLSRGLLEETVARQQRLAGLPVLANLDFGHTCHSPPSHWWPGGKHRLRHQPGPDRRALTCSSRRQAHRRESSPVPHLLATGRARIRGLDFELLRLRDGASAATRGCAKIEGASPCPYAFPGSASDAWLRPRSPP